MTFSILVSKGLSKLCFLTAQQSTDIRTVGEKYQGRCGNGSKEQHALFT